MKKLHTGGATGSDCVFATCALNKNIEVVIHTFEGHHVTLPNSKVHGTIQVHPWDELEVAMPYLMKANKTLNREIPINNQYVQSLLCRNYYQIKDSNCVVAVGKRKGNVIDGGTGWGVQMALDMGMPVFFLDITRNSNIWIASFGRGRLASVWHKPDLNKYDVIAGIGTRNLPASAAEIIRSLF